MENYAHITEMEKIRIQQGELLEELNERLDTLDVSREEYRTLMEYYYSDQRAQDLKDDANHRIPQNLKRGVLSEDELYELMGDYRDTAMRMLEIAVQMLKV